MAIKATVSMTNNIGRAGDQVISDLVDGLNLGAERGMALALDRVPMDQGTLSEAHTVLRATDPEEGSAIVADTPYAARLHEHPEYDFSTKSNPQAQGKWVENAVIDGKAEIGDIIRKRVRG